MRGDIIGSTTTVGCLRLQCACWSVELLSCRAVELLCCCAVVLLSCCAGVLFAEGDMEKDQGLPVAQFST